MWPTRTATAPGLATMSLAVPARKPLFTRSLARAAAARSVPASTSTAKPWRVRFSRSSAREATSPEKGGRAWAGALMISFSFSPGMVRAKFSQQKLAFFWAAASRQGMSS